MLDENAILKKMSSVRKKKKSKKKKKKKKKTKDTNSRYYSTFEIDKSIPQS